MMCLGTRVRGTQIRCQKQYLLLPLGCFNVEDRKVRGAGFHWSSLLVRRESKWVIGQELVKKNIF